MSLSDLEMIKLALLPKAFVPIYSEILYTSRCDHMHSAITFECKMHFHLAESLLLPSNLGQGTMTRGNHGLIRQGKDHLAHLFLG